MIMKKISFLFILSIIALITSCSQSDELSQHVNQISKEDVVPVISYDSLGRMNQNYFLNNYHVSERNDSLYEIISQLTTKNVSSRSQRVSATETSGGPYTVTGYTSSTLTNTYKAMFSTVTTAMQNLGLSSGVIYIIQSYLYKYRITIPHNSSLILPPKSNMSNMGLEPSNTSIYNYDAISISTSTDGDVYDLTTQSNVVKYLVSGQEITPVYLPLNFGNDPNNLTFKYAWTTITW